MCEVEELHNCVANSQKDIFIAKMIQSTMHKLTMACI
jgi:hypothetical protein